MLKRLERAVYFALFACLLLGFGIVVWSSQPPEQPIQTKASQSANQSPNASHPLKDFWDWTTHDAISFYTFVLAIFTGILGVSTVLLWRATKRSVRVAERALTELEAPFISVEITDPGISFDQMRQVSLGDLKFRFNNYGRTPAHILGFIEDICSMDIGKGPPPAIDPDQRIATPMPYGVIAPPNGSSQESRHTIIPGLYGQRRSFAGLLKAAFFIGYIQYRDIFEADYLLGFCFIFDPTSNRWILAGGREHNYCRKEKAPPPPSPPWYRPMAKTDTIAGALSRIARKQSGGT